MSASHVTTSRSPSASSEKTEPAPRPKAKTPGRDPGREQTKGAHAARNDDDLASVLIAGGQEFERELLYSEAVEHLRAILASLGMTQHELAERLEVSDARVSRIFTGRENLTLRTLADISFVLGLRFEFVATPMPEPERARTPAHADPPPPRWLLRHAQLVVRRLRDATKPG